jgi:hypothetical protein
MKRRIRLLLGATLALFAVVLLVGAFGRAEAKGSDRSLTVLAGSTAILDGRRYPVVQRPPLYSAFVAALGLAGGIEPTPAADAAREYGNIHRLPVGKEFLTPAFLRLVLVAQAVIFLGTVALVLASLRLAGCSPHLTLLAGGLLLATPNSWLGVTQVHDAALTQFLIAAAVAALAFFVARGAGAVSAAVAGAALALAGLSHAAFQLLAPAVAASLLLLWLFGRIPKRSLRAAAIILGIWIAVVGLWSLRNLKCCGFFGVSAVAGSTLGTRTFSYLERALPAHPEEVSVFLRLRQETILKSPENSGLLWTDRAARWLMEARGLDYVEANAFLLRVNLAAIRRAPMSYLLAVAESVPGFFWTLTPSKLGSLRPLFAAADFSLAFLFLGITGLWASFHLLPRLRREPPRRVEPVDCLIVLSLVVFWYAAVVFCAIDVGKPQQRAPVQFVMPMLVAMGLSRLRSRPAGEAVSPPALPSPAASPAGGPPWPPG